MEHFSSDGLGYNKSEVNEFVDYVIKKTEENIYTIKSQLDEIKRLQEELAKKVEEIAIKNDTSFNNVVISMIEYCLKEIEKD